MVMRVDILIYIYIMLCICMLAFDLVYLKKNNRGIKHLKSKKKQCKKYILALSLENSSERDKAKRQLTQKLHKFSFLMTFHDVVMKLLNREKTSELMEKWLHDNSDLFLEIKEDYMGNRSTNKKAFYAYLVWQYSLCRSDNREAFASMMQMLVVENSIYCRENALMALYVGGNAADVAKAYRQMVNNDILHSQKLVTDGLLAFQGNHEELFEELWRYRKEFSPYYGVAFINYIRMASSGFEERFFNLLKRDSVDSEVRIAIVRYFRSHPYKDAMEYLRNMVKNWKDYDWEIVSQAALTLERDLQSMKTVQALIEGCRSTNWYIRKNSAESLFQMKDKRLLEIVIISEKDRYARDMMNYKFEEKQE